MPGYGLAVAQAQHTVVELARALEARGVEVAYAIHPVAGRMPGHMNVLLAEADVPYESLDDLEAANAKFSAADVALVVGANDVVNPAARDDPTSPLYGMPILNADQAAHVVFMKRSMRPGFSGVDNALLYDPRTVLLFGDAKESLDQAGQCRPGRLSPLVTGSRTKNDRRAKCPGRAARRRLAICHALVRWGWA